MIAQDHTDVSFHEEQRFNQRWIWLLLGGMNVLMVAIFGYGLVEQLVYGRPWGANPVSDAALIWTTVAMLMFIVAINALLLAMRLVTEVRTDGLHIHFRPLVRRHIPFDEIRRAEARTYRPIREYGGWGIRYGFGGKAYNVKGDEGVQLEFRNGKRLLIGSQRAGELEAAIAGGLKMET